MDRRSLFKGLAASVAVAALPVWALARRPPEPIKVKALYVVIFKRLESEDGSMCFEIETKPVSQAA